MITLCKKTFLGIVGALVAQDQKERPYFTFIESLTLIWSTLETVDC